MNGKQNANIDPVRKTSSDRSATSNILPRQAGLNQRLLGVYE
jgi:hypothetical protein